MSKRTSLAIILVGSIALFAAPRAKPVVRTVSKAVAEPLDLERLMSWLPADTETISVARGPFVLTSSTVEHSDAQTHPISDKELAQNFQELPLALLEFKNGLLTKHLALEGARHFRPPAGLGEMPFEGCAIVFSEGLRTEITSFAKEARSSGAKVEQIEDQEISVFQEKLEGDTWTTFVAFPSENVVLVATNRNYLAEVLARLRSHNSQRALPDDLPEWKYVDTNARFWGLRHYDKSQAQSDPSSPFGGRKSANFPDERAIGLTFVFDPRCGKSAKITYLSGDTSIATKPSSSPLGMGRSPESNGLDIRYRELAPGIVEGSYSLEQSQAVQFFLFVLEGTLGHAVYL